MSKWLHELYLSNRISKEMMCVFSTDKCSSLEWKSLAKYHQFLTYHVYLTNSVCVYRDSQRNQQERYTYLGHGQVSGELCCSKPFRQIKFSFEKWWEWHTLEPFLVETAVPWATTYATCCFFFFFFFLCLAREIAGGNYSGMGPEGNTWNWKTRTGERK